MDVLTPLNSEGCMYRSRSGLLGLVLAVLLIFLLLRLLGVV